MDKNSRDLLENKKEVPRNRYFFFLVRVTGLEPAAS